MKNHLKILGVLYLLHGLLGVLVVAGYLNARTEFQTLVGSSMLPFSTHGFGVILVFLFAATSLLGVLGGLALLAEKSWAGSLILILGFINLLNLPLGAMLGIYTIWVLTRAEHLKLWQSGYDGGYDSRIFPPYHRT
ncbi:MAG: hypothetical protein AAB354_11090 [candidate division KSB1 bacterium]